MAVDVSGNPRPDDPVNDPAPPPFTLTVAPKMISDGRAVIEVVEGVPFELTATVTISEGTFSDNSTMMPVTIETGETQSDEFAYIETDLSTTITVTAITSPPELRDRR